MVQDYRYLNAWTIKNNYPLPLISELVDKVGKARVFTKAGLEMGVQQCEDQGRRQVEGSVHNAPWGHSSQQSCFSA